MQKKLSYKKLKRSCEPTCFHFKSTKELAPLKEIIGQERAVRALRFGLAIKHQGFNIYAAGRPGTGRETTVREFLEGYAKNKPVPPDICYVNNFHNPYEPRAITLPAGKGNALKKDMEKLISEARRLLPGAFKSEHYAAKREETLKAFEEERKKLFEGLNEKARKEGFAIQSTPTGLLIIPIKDGKLLSEQQFMSLKPEIKKAIQKKKEILEKGLKDVVRQLREIEAKGNEASKKLNRDVAFYVTQHLIETLFEKYKSYKEVIDYLKEVEEDILDNLSLFLKKDQTTSSDPSADTEIELLFRKYRVNVIVDNSNLKGAPVIIEHNPTFQNLFGRIEKESRMGVLSTDFTMIHSGSLHRANGGYIVLTAEELLQNIFSWEGLKRALMNRQVVIEEAGERLGFISTKGLKPEPLPLEVKVVLIGTNLVYHLLYTRVTEFKELFKVKAEFDTSMTRNRENTKKYASFICTFCEREKLKHLDTSAVSKIVEYGSRLAEDKEKLSTKFSEIGDILREANFYATEEHSRYIKNVHIMRAVEEKSYRSNLIKEKIQEMIKRGLILIDTAGMKIGQVNGLSVIDMGDFAFGRPSRVTATIGMGREGIIDIEREVKLGGPIHSKGVMILGGYLNSKYAQDKPLSLSARLVFEQSYSGVEGDSASSTELYAILSALSGLPIKQSIAVTGSVNQKGEIQAIGGVNEKIEGFFEICRFNGLTGDQGVIIPKSNVQNLMLKDNVIDEVKKGKFHIYSVNTIDEGIEILTGVKAGKKRKGGEFTRNSVNFLVNKRLREIAENLREFPEREHNHSSS